MSKKAISTVLLLSLALFVSGCAGISTSEVGKGVQVGSMSANAGALSPVLWLVGEGMQSAGGKGGRVVVRSRQDDQAIWAVLARNSLGKRFDKDVVEYKLKTREDMKEYAQDYCQCIDRKITKGEAIAIIRRGDLIKNGVDSDSLPEGDENMQLAFVAEQNPFTNCGYP